MADTNKLKLKSSDGIVFEVDQEVALQSVTVKNMIANADVPSSSEPISLPNVSGCILVKVILYCKYHVDAKKPGTAEKPAVTDDEVKAWDQEFVKVDTTTLFDLISAAKYLDIDGLLTLTCDTVAGMIRGKTPEEIRRTFNIDNSYTPEEEEEIRRVR
ncbi:unnamed protein product [Closterium sp. Yama58-4]|nr:unnamed protein product [Closterium sp. Yama58-4]